MFGNPPFLEVLGRHADIVSSKIFVQLDVMILFLIWLKSSTALLNAHQGSQSFCIGCSKILGKKKTEFLEPVQLHVLVKISPLDYCIPLVIHSFLSSSKQHGSRLAETRCPNYQCMSNNKISFLESFHNPFLIQPISFVNSSVHLA